MPRFTNYLAVLVLLSAIPGVPAVDAAQKDTAVALTDGFDNLQIGDIDPSVDLAAARSFEADKTLNGRSPIKLGGTDGLNRLSFTVPSKFVGLTLSFLPDAAATGNFAQIFSEGDVSLGISVSDTEFSLYRFDGQQGEWVLLADRFEYLHEDGYSRYAFLSVVEVEEGTYLALNARIIGYLENHRLSSGVTLEGTNELPIYWGPMDVYEVVPEFVIRFEENLSKERFSGLTQSQRHRHLERQGFVKAPPVEGGSLSYQEEAWLPSHSLNRRVWEDVFITGGGQDFSAYVSGKIRPTTSDLVPDLQARPWKEPWEGVSIQDNYLEIIEGYIVPPEEGDYTFWISGDDYAGLYISPTASAEDCRLIAETTTPTSREVWNSSRQSKSAKVSLERGKAYFLRVIHQETTGDNHFSVGWAKPSDGESETPQELVPTQYLSSLSSNEPGMMPRFLIHNGQELLPDMSSVFGYYSKLSYRRETEIESYQQMSLPVDEALEVPDFGTGWADHPYLGWLYSNEANFPYIWKSGTAGKFEPTIDEWYFYTEDSANPQVFQKEIIRYLPGEMFKVYSSGLILFVPQFDGAAIDPLDLNVTKTVGESHTFLAPLYRFVTPNTNYWKLDGVQIPSSSSSSTPLTHTVSGIMKSSDEGVYTAYISAPGGADTSLTFTLNVNKADQTTAVTISSVPSSLTYQSVDDLDASGGNGTGSFGYEVEDPAKGQIINGDDIKALSGTGTVRVRAYRAADANYNIRYSSWSAPIDLNPATPTVTSWPGASGITYPQSLASSTLSGGSASVPGSFSWTNPSTVPNAGTSSYPVTFTPNESSNYSSVTGSAQVTVSKGTPTVSSWPGASGITYPQSLASSTLSGGSASVPGSFSWTNPSTVPNAGTSTQAATFTPSDTTNYNTRAGTTSINVSPGVQASVMIYSVPSTLSYMAVDDLNADGGSGGGYYGYEVSNSTLAAIISGDDVVAKSGVGSVSVRSYRTGDPNWETRYSSWVAINLIPQGAGSPNPTIGQSVDPSIMTLDWGDVTYATSYDVYLGTSWSSVNNALPYSPEFQGNVFSSELNSVSLQASTTYYWRVDPVNSLGYKKKGNVWHFTTQSPPPNPATNPSPSNSTTAQLINTDLSWSNGGGAVSFSVYFGTNSTPGVAEYKDEITETTWDPGALAYGTTYYWRIDSENGTGTTTGNVWSFTTQGPPPEQASGPNPADLADVQSINVDLDWADATGADTYDVYFGPDQALVASASQSDPQYQGSEADSAHVLATLSYSTTYYWRVDTVNSTGTTAGAVWSFTTENYVPPPQITSSSTASGTELLPFSYTITATNNPTSFSASGLPAWLTRTGDAISGTPPFGSRGEFEFTVSATNAGGTGNQLVTLTIVEDLTDTDSDGLPDNWELVIVDFTTEDNLTSIYDVHPYDDFDQDGISNADEYSQGSDATNSSSMDSDSLPDDWEQFYNLSNLPDNEVELADSDNDGLTNIEEFNLGTSPIAMDSDSDGWTDSVEVAMNSSPIDELSLPEPIVKLHHGGQQVGKPGQVLYGAYTVSITTAQGDPLGNVPVEFSSDLGTFLALDDQVLTEMSGVSTYTDKRGLVYSPRNPVHLKLPSQTDAVVTVTITSGASSITTSAETKSAALVPVHPPGFVDAEDLGEGSYSVTWEDMSDHETGYVIEMQNPDGTWSAVGTVGPNTTTFTYQP